MTVLRVCYKHGIRFDEGYYTSTHLPLVGAVMGSAVKKIEVVRVLSTGDGSTPPYQTMFSAYFDSPAALQEARQNPRMPEVLADIKNFYDGTPELLIGEVLALTSPV